MVKKVVDENQLINEEMNWKIVCTFYALRLLDRWFKQVENYENSKYSIMNRVRRLVGLPRDYRELSPRDKYEYWEMKKFIADYFNGHLAKQESE